jgi:small multidrug resistance pump
MVKTYTILLIAIFFEVAGTMLLPVSQNFTKFIPSICLAIFYLVSFYLMTFVMDKIPIAIVYATWSGLGVFTVAILGFLFFKQSLAWQSIIGLILIILGVILVNSFTDGSVKF